MWKAPINIQRQKTRAPCLLLALVHSFLVSKFTAFHVGRVHRNLHYRRGKFHSRSSLLRGARLPFYFSVGEPVLVVETQQAGVIQEVRGSGWYAVSLAQDTGSDAAALSTTVRKFRTSQLEPVLLNQTQLRTTAANNSLPEIPAVIDYDDPSLPLDPAFRLQLDTFREVQHWIVFSDLHCSAASLATCRQVLDDVHRHAVERNAGILFLGDFWHVRGTLRVATLNAVLDQLRTAWTQPLIAIPGNHDQCSWKANENHALQPLRDAYRIPATNYSNSNKTSTVSGVLLFSRPCRFQNALWLPHLRDPSVVRSLLQQQATSVVFCHVDCYGASRNDQAISTGGIRLSDLPPGVPVYSGHYHAPHVLEDSCHRRLEYVGSPYQVTLSEANQEKRLMVLDCNSTTSTWKRKPDIPIHIGRRHHIVSSIEELDALQPQPGDRVVATVAEGEASAISNAAQPLREAGVTVEIRSMAPTPNKAREETSTAKTIPIEDLSPLSVWQQFCTLHNHTDLVYTTGKEILDAMEQPSTAQQQLLEQRDGPNLLELESVTLQGFGPFVEQVTYPLCDRGLVLLSGVNDDDDGADSNGSGKTSLVMSILWALTGSIDPRPLQDSKAADIVNDCCKVAQVTVSGRLNGKEFVVCRSKTSSRGRLTLMIGGQDMTAPSIRETQDLLDEALGVPSGVVSRSLFQGQHLAQSELLDATDVKFKTELSLVVPLDLWNDAAGEARQRAKHTSLRLAELAGMRSLRKDDERLLEESINSMLIAVERKEDEYAMAVKAVAEFQEHDATCGPLSTFADVETDLTKTINGLGRLEAERASILEKEEETLQAASDEQAHVEEEVLHHLNTKLEAERRCADRSTQYSLANQKVIGLGDLWGIELSDNLPDSIRLPEHCPVCHQTVVAQESLRQRVMDDILGSLATLADCSALKEQAETDLANKTALHISASHSLELLASKVQSVRDLSKHSLLELDTRISDERKKMEELSYLLASKAKQVENARLQELQSTSTETKTGLEIVRQQLLQIQGEMKRCRESIEEVDREVDELSGVLVRMKSIAEMFSARGVQTFVLRNALSALESSAQTYLAHLSDSSLRLELAMTDKLERRVYLRNSKGVLTERPLGALSGGQWRRCSLSLQLAFVDLVSSRFRCSLAVWDEPLTHLDQQGRTRVGVLFRSLLTSDKFSTVLMILQDLAADELGESFDEMDEVRRSGDCSKVQLGRHAAGHDSF